MEPVSAVRDARLIERVRAICRHPLLPEPTGVASRLGRLPGIRALLFDVYGTLFVSASGDIGAARVEAQERALRDALRSSGFSGNLDEAARAGAGLLLERIRGTHEELRLRGIEHPEVDIRSIWSSVLKTLRAEGLLSGEALDDESRRLAVEYECRINPVWPVPALAKTLAQLRRRGLVLGIVSNAQFYTAFLFRALLGQSLEELGFEDVFCQWSYSNREAKPSAGLYERLLARLAEERAISPPEALYVGNDMLNDVLPAAGAGLRTALFAGDRRSLRLREDDDRCRAVEPDLVVEKLDQILECV